MSLSLGGGDSNNTSTSSASGWGPAPAPSSGWGSSTVSSSSSGWNQGSSSNQASFGTSSLRATTNGELDSTPSSSLKGSSSWAQAVSSGPNHLQQQPQQSNSSQIQSSGSRSHCESNSREGVKSKSDESKESLLRSVPEPLLLDNWGQTVINQDKSWDLPPSPQESKMGSKEVSKEREMLWVSVSSGPDSKTGTELWESSVRQKQQSKQASSGLSSSMSTAVSSSLVPPPPSTSVMHSNASSSQWNHAPVSNIGGTWGEEEDTSSAHWTGVPQTNGGSSSQSLSSHSNASNGSWGGTAAKINETVIEASSSSWGEHPAKVEEDNRREWAGNSWDRQRPPLPPPEQQPVPASGWRSDAMQAASKVPSSSTASWKKDSASGSGWDEETMNGDANGSASDDGTSVWGNPVRQQQQLKVRKWADESEQLQQINAKPNNMTNNSSANNGIINAPVSQSVSSPNGSGLLPSSPGMIRLPNKAPSNEWRDNKQQPDRQWNERWGESGENRSRNWADSSSHHSSHDTSPSSPSSASYWGQRSQRSNASWSDGQIDTSSWSGPKQKPLTKEMIWASKQFRILTEQGCKKEEAEAVLRSCNMNLDEAMILLRSLSPWTASDKQKSPTDAGNTPTSSSSLLLTGQSSKRGGPNVLPTLNEVTSALRSRNPQRHPTLPSENQLIHLVKEIQLAVHSGHLQAQILNQPLAPPTVQLIYELLQQIKHLQQLQAQVSKMGLSSNPSQVHVHMTQTKQRITSLQNQITLQQALFMQKNNPSARSSVSVNEGNMTPLNDFADLSLKDQGSSRFETTWKRSFDSKESDSDVFSRAPGGKTDWTGMESWSEGNDSLFKEQGSSQATAAPPVFMADLGVPEFEPGKPWKGSSQLKSIEDDPHMTPGSVNRSPLSVSFDNWSSKVSPTEVTANNESSLNPLSLASSGTWSFSTPSSTAFSADPLKSKAVVTAPSSSSWTSIGETSDSLWSNNTSAANNTSVPKTRPPPGLSQSSLDYYFQDFNASL